MCMDLEQRSEYSRQKTDNEYEKKEKTMDLLEIMRNRRSVRKYTSERIDDEKIETVLQAGMLSASSRGRRPWEFIVVRNRETLERMANSRVAGAAMLKGADAAIVVIADPEKCDVWVEDCSIVMANMHLMADSLGLGSCWIQGRLRMASEGVEMSGDRTESGRQKAEEPAEGRRAAEQPSETTEEYLRKLLGFPESYRLEAMLSLGMPASHPAPYDLQTVISEMAGRVHREVY